MPFFDISASAFAKYLAHIPTNTTKFFSVIFPALKQSIKEQNPNVLKTHLAKFALKTEPEIFFLYLKATQDFINSRDCQYEGKYQFKSYFFGGIRLTSTAPFLQSLNAAIDDMRESIHKPQSTSKHSILFSGYQTLKSGVTIFTSRPVILLTAILSYRTQIAYAANAMTTHKVELDQCSATTSFLQQTSQFMPYEYTIPDIHTFYRIHQNTDTPLNQVNTFLFGEAHHNDTHHSLKRYFISLLGKPGDYVLFEGISSQLTVPCEQLKFDSKFICNGWEKYSLYREVHDQVIPNIHIQNQSLKIYDKLSPLSRDIVHEFYKIHAMKSKLLAESEKLIRLVHTYEQEKIKWINTINEKSSDRWKAYAQQRIENINIEGRKIQSKRAFNSNI